YGVLADNTWKQTLSMSDHITFTSEGPAFRVLVIEGATPQEVLSTLADLTGKMPLPPLWSLGFQQSRYSYVPESRAKEVVDTFRDKQIPIDVLWFDIDYMDDFKVFTFDEESYPDPQAMNAYLHQHKMKGVWMIDPGVGIEEGYSVYDSGTELDVWMKDADDEVYEGEVWPGPTVFPDYTQPKTAEWWSDLYRDFMAQDIDGVWNDMNEPADFTGPDGSVPEDNIHGGGLRLTPNGKPLPADSHLRYHNVYGMLMVRASRQGIADANPDKRPFVLTRANYLGGQRYAATWTGDNNSTWEHLRLSVPMSLNLGLSGQPFNGPDIGGFIGNASPELFGHWMAIGAFYPFARAHSAIESDDQEPWVFGPEVEEASRVALQRRYRLMPYLYTQFYRASETGIPVMQPTFFADVADTG
ncbi:MAG: glycoside hydrolase family 31 protein, partial [Gammaproteobacteria bacterium]